MLRMYDVASRLLDGITSMYVNSPACVRVKGGESKCFRIDSDARRGCIMSLFPYWVFNMYMYVVMKEVKMGMERMEKGRE